MPGKQKSNSLLKKLSGLATIATSIAVCLSLITWDMADPSFTHAADRTVSNLLGFAGAAIADLLIQFLGFAASVLALSPAIWGWQLFHLKQSRIRASQILGFLGIILCSCGVLACLPTPPTWPLPTGLGGLIGNAVIALPESFVTNGISGLTAFVVALAFFLPLIPLTYFVFFPNDNALRGVDQQLPAHKPTNFQEDDAPFLEDVSEGWFFSTFLGGLAHLGLSTTTKIRKLIGLQHKQLRHQSVPQHDLTMTYPLEGKTGFEKLIRRLKSLKNRVIDNQSENDGLGHYFDQDSARNLAGEASIHKSDNAFSVTGHLGGSTAYTGWDEAVPSRSETNSLAGDLPGTDQAQTPASPGIAGSGSAIDAIPAVSPPVTIRASAPGHAQKNRMPATVPTTLSEPPQPAFKTPGDFQLPSLHLLSEAPDNCGNTGMSNAMLTQNAHQLKGVLADFGVKGDIIHVRPGPVVTLYELEPAPGIKSSRVIGLADDIARSMSAIAARVAVVPGKNAIGIELPNAKREMIYLRESIAARSFSANRGKLPICLGKTIGGEGVIADLAKMPHLLVAGTTGSGKSVAINTMILSLLYRLKPEQCRMIMIDPKMLELSVYDGIPHLLTPVVTDPKKAVSALKWTVREMEDRYRKMSKVGVRNIDGFNTRVGQATKMGEAIIRTIQTGYDQETGEAIYEREELALEPLPFIVVIIDEMADLMMVAGKEIEGTIQRLAQMARAAGIHVIMATQRPSVDVITGTIKANFPTRISFQVTSKIDSRTILGEQGAEQLLGMGDMLYMAGGGRVQRVHGPFVGDGEVEDVVRHLKDQGIPQYLGAVIEELDEDGEQGSAGAGVTNSDADEPYDKAVAIVLRDKKVSTSYVQRRLGIGYNRAASIVERMEEEGIISAANHAGKREILVGNEPEKDFAFSE